MTSEIRIPVTAIILTLNEERNIERCLECIDNIDDVVLVDSLSADETIGAARRARPDVRVFEHRFIDFGDQRNWALGNTSPVHEWVLFIDADEFCTNSLIKEIADFVRHPGDHVGAYIAGRNYFLGRWLRRSTMYPSYQLRLLKNGHVTFQKEGHGQREVTKGPLRYLESNWNHEAMSKGLHQWIERHNNYSSDEVDLILRLRREELKPTSLMRKDPIERRRALKILAARIPLRPLMRFTYTYFIKLGFLDGYPGFIYCCLRVAHDIHIVAKLAERHYRESKMADVPDRSKHQHG